jgi:hypothetical protein
MCRSIQTLRPPFTEEVTDDLIRAAALQYVRKIAGMRSPSAANRDAFEAAVEQIALATSDLLGGISVRPSRPRTPTAALSE